jgi:hypothetical protein
MAIVSAMCTSHARSGFSAAYCFELKGKQDGDAQ